MGNRVTTFLNSFEDSGPSWCRPAFPKSRIKNVNNARYKPVPPNSPKPKYAYTKPLNNRIFWYQPPKIKTNPKPLKSKIESENTVKFPRRWQFPKNGWIFPCCFCRTPTGSVAQDLRVFTRAYVCSTCIKERNVKFRRVTRLDRDVFGKYR